MSSRNPEHLQVREAGEGVLVATFDAANHGLVGPDQAAQLLALVERADRDPAVRAVILTGAHPERFVSHADVGWLQHGGAASPAVGRPVASVIAKVAHFFRRHRLLCSIARLTPLWGAVQLDSLHESLLAMNRSGTIFIAALNGSALGLGAEIAWACDVRLMADGPYFIGHPEVLLGFAPGAGGTQRLPRLIGGHHALLAMIEGAPLPAKEAFALGAVDEIVASELLADRALEWARRLISRRKEAIQAIKRAVYLGSSRALEQGLHLERTEFLTSLPQQQAQELMIGYLHDTDTHGELGFYRPEAFSAAQQRGTMSADSTSLRI